MKSIKNYKVIDCIKKIVIKEAVFPVQDKELKRTTTLGELGIDSLKVIQVILQIEEQLSMKLDFTCLSKNPLQTLGDLFDAVIN